MWLTGFDSPPLHTLYVDKPMRGAALMQALARVNRTFRDKQDGLLVGYAPLTENLLRGARRVHRPRPDTPGRIGHDIDDALAKVRDLLPSIGDVILAGYDWRARWLPKRRGLTSTRSSGQWTTCVTPQTPGNQVEEGELTLADRFRQEAAQLARLYALCSTQRDLRDLPRRHRVLRGGPGLHGQVRRRGAPGPRRVGPAGRRAVPEVSSPRASIEAGGVTDIYDAAGIGRPDLSHLDEAFIERMQRPAQSASGHRGAAPPDRAGDAQGHQAQHRPPEELLRPAAELMRRYTNQHLTAAEIIAELVALAKEVSADANRGAQFAPPLTPTSSPSTTRSPRTSPPSPRWAPTSSPTSPATWSKSLRRDVTTDWVSRDDVRAKIRSTIKRLLAKYGYPPDAQPDATELVLRQMETFADEWSPDASRATRRGRAIRQSAASGEASCPAAS